MTCHGKITQAIKIEGGSHTFRSRLLISKPTSFTRHCVGDKAQSTGKPQHTLFYTLPSNNLNLLRHDQQDQEVVTKAGSDTDEREGMKSERTKLVSLELGYK